MISARHDHDDTDTLTFGCPGCLQRVDLDQWEASWLTAPVRHCTWTFVVKDKRPTFTLDVRVPPGADSEDVDDRYMDLTGPPLSDAIAAMFPKATADDHNTIMMEACERMVSVTIGAIVPESATTIDTPSLFDGAA